MPRQSSLRGVTSRHRHLRAERREAPGELDRDLDPRNLRWWRAKFGAYTLADVTPARLVECKNQLLATQTRRKRPMSPATVVRYMASLSHAFTVAVNDWQRLDDSPILLVQA